MHKVFGYVLLLVIGLSVGVSIGTMIQIPQTSQLGTEGKVTLIDVECVFSDHTALRIILKNRFTERVLNGNVTVYQDGRRWTSEVDWRTDWRDGYGFAEVKCNSLVNQSLRLKYTEKYPSETYLDRIVEWEEVRVSDESMTWTFLKTEELTFTSYTWGTDNANITLVVQNTGSGALTISAVQVGGVEASSYTITPAALEPGDSSTIVITQAFTSGVKYEFAVVTAKGNAFGPYIKTAP